jgi:hypothetical protein
MSLSVTKSTCYAGIFKRLNYFDGMLLTEEDFQEEQHYLREKAKLHNRLHGYGVVWGLGLTSKCIEVDEKQVFKIFIEPGFALDRAGNEILVCQPHRVDVEAKLLDLRRSCATLDPPPTLCIGIEYCECKSNPEPQHLSLHCEDDPQPTQFSRVREGYNVRIFTEEEFPECCTSENARAKTDTTRDEPGCLGLSSCCGEQCVIILGCIKDYFTVKDNQGHVTYPFPENIATHPFPPERIETCYQPPAVHTGHASAHAQWEYQKQLVLKATCEAFHWIDLSVVVNQSVQIAWNYLEENGLVKGNSLKIDNIEEANRPALMERIEKAISCVAPGTTIDLITDQHDCVLFALPQDGGA